jgi:serine/threonine protein kinase
VLASLNHSNIAQIYGVDERALAMDATQIAEAFEAAYEKGIIHRDLKPRQREGDSGRRGEMGKRSSC